VDRFNLLLDESEETIIDPIHLLRYYDFATDGEKIELIVISDKSDTL
jgi:CRISPR-associated endonuclease/helicase Cas3